jgi:hypothetical protein
MVEDPIKLFSTRAERYPEPTDTDHAQGAARAALAAIPVIAGTITEVAVNGAGAGMSTIKLSLISMPEDCSTHRQVFCTRP